MPTYEYICKACGHRFDIWQSFSDDALTTCDQCNGSLRKVFGNVGITFKGSGFYKTDSRPAPKEGSDSKSSGSSKSDSTSSDSKSESKSSESKSSESKSSESKSSESKGSGHSHGSHSHTH